MTSLINWLINLAPNATSEKPAHYTLVIWCDNCITLDNTVLIFKDRFFHTKFLSTLSRAQNFPSEVGQNFTKKIPPKFPPLLLILALGRLLMNLFPYSPKNFKHLTSSKTYRLYCSATICVLVKVLGLRFNSETEITAFYFSEKFACTNFVSSNKQLFD